MNSLQDKYKFHPQKDNHGSSWNIFVCGKAPIITKYYSVIHTNTTLSKPYN
jgi:hypothetical protein